MHDRRPGLPPVIGQLVATLLAKNPEDRPPDAATVRGWLAEVRRTLPPAAPALTIPIPVAGPERSVPPHRPPMRRRWLLATGGGAAVAVLLALALTHVGAHPAQAGSPASSRPAATAAPSRPAATKAVSRRQPAPHRHIRHHAPVTPAGAVDALRLAIVKSENSGAIQPSAATDLQNQLSDISQSISQGNLQDAGQKVGDLQQHLDDLTGNGQISARGLAMIGPPVSELARLLPQQS